MVKLDLSRDYYGDLELCPTSSSVEIKKQYKKLALLYHPDRNIGSNTSDATKFQRIQAAYEILNDPLEREKYDANRRVSLFTNVSNGHTKYQTRGNPWSNFGKEYPPPPKPPTTRNFQAPPPSNGARRYEKFVPPKQTAYQASQEGSQARKARYDAWEKMRGQHGGTTTFPSSGYERKVPDPPPRDIPKSNRKERRPTPPTRSQMSDTPNDRNHRNDCQGSNVKSSRKKGFKPNLSGVDDLPASKGHCFTTYAKPDPPPIPSRAPKSPNEYNCEHLSNNSSEVDLNIFFTERVSTPYALHGGERFDPFEAPRGKLSRSKSTAEKRPKNKAKNNLFYDEMNMDTKFYSSNRTRSFGGHSNATQKTVTPSDQERSDSEETIDISLTTKSSDRAKHMQNEAHRTATTTSHKIPSDSPQLGQKMDESINESSRNSPVYQSSRSKKSKMRSSENSNIFSFSLEDDTFVNTKYAYQEPRLGKSTENISTRFSAEDWDGKFSAGSGSDYFNPNAYSARRPSHQAHSGNRVRSRSPKKSKPGAERTARTETKSECLGERRFSADEWAETFLPQTFMPPPPTLQPIVRPGTGSVNGRKRTIPVIRQKVSANALSTGDSKNVSKNSIKTSHESGILNTNMANTVTPEPMDIDNPLELNDNPNLPKSSDDISSNNFESQESQASHSALPVNEADVWTSALKVNFSDLNIRDPVLDFPFPPNQPVLSQNTNPSASYYHEQEAKYQQYMSEWDQFDKKFLLHLVVRKNKNEVLGDKRWKGQVAEYYRNTVREDQIVLRKWAEAKQIHEKVMTEWIVFTDLMREVGLVEGEDEKPQAELAKAMNSQIISKG